MNIWSEVQTVVTENRFYEKVVLSTLENLRAKQDVLGFLLDLSTSFEQDGLVRQQLILLLTKSSMLVCYTEEIPDLPDSDSSIRVSTEVIPLRNIGPFQVQRYYSNPADFGSDNCRLNEIVLSLSWTGNRTIDVGPASCDDPECANEHGYTGQTRLGDYSAKYSLKNDNQYWIDHAEKFAVSLERLLNSSHDH